MDSNTPEIIQRLLDDEEGGDHVELAMPVSTTTEANPNTLPVFYIYLSVVIRYYKIASRLLS